MKWSLSLGKLFGIGVFVHWTFLILIAWIVFMNVRLGQGVEETIAAIIFVLAIFACVTFHELGHALAARRYKIGTRHITLLPIGGVAMLEDMPEKPMQELVVAVAGPLVNVAIAIVLSVILLLTDSFPVITEDLEISYLDFNNFLFLLLVANLILVVFNVIPAFPMDGGRIFRALLSFKMDRIKATNIASGMGQVFAIGFVLVGFLTGNIFLIFIGIFVFLGAQAEASMVRTKGLLKNFTVKDVMMTQMQLIQVDQPIKYVVKVILDGQEKEFIVMEGDKVAGVLTRDQVIKGLSEKGKDASVGEIISKDFLELSPDQPLDEVQHKMMMKRFVISPVVYNNELIGILNTENINEFMMIKNALSTDV